MSKLEKVKEFCKEHKGDLVYLGFFGGTVLYGMSMYIYGFRAARKRDVASLSVCCIAKPELKPMLEEALTKVQETIK